MWWKNNENDTKNILDDDTKSDDATNEDRTILYVSNVPSYVYL